MQYILNNQEFAFACDYYRKVFDLQNYNLIEVDKSKYTDDQCIKCSDGYARDLYYLCKATEEATGKKVEESGNTICDLTTDECKVEKGPLPPQFIVWSNYAATTFHEIVIDDCHYVQVPIRRSCDLMKNYKVRGSGILNVFLTVDRDVVFEGTDGPSESFPIVSAVYGQVSLFIEVQSGNFNIESVTYDAAVVSLETRDKIISMDLPHIIKGYRCILHQGSSVSSDFRRNLIYRPESNPKKRDVNVKTIHRIKENGAQTLSVSLNAPFGKLREVAFLDIRSTTPHLIKNVKLRVNGQEVLNGADPLAPTEYVGLGRPLVLGIYTSMDAFIELNEVASSGDVVIIQRMYKEVNELYDMKSQFYVLPNFVVADGITLCLENANK